MQVVVNTYCVGSHVLALSIFLTLFSSLGCAHTRDRLVYQSRLLAHVIDNTKIGQEKQTYGTVLRNADRGSNLSTPTSCPFLHSQQFQATDGQTIAQMGLQLCGARSGSPQLYRNSGNECAVIIIRTARNSVIQILSGYLQGGHTDLQIVDELGITLPAGQQLAYRAFSIATKEPPACRCQPEIRRLVQPHYPEAMSLASTA